MSANIASQEEVAVMAKKPSSRANKRPKKQVQAAEFPDWPEIGKPVPPVEKVIADFISGATVVPLHAGFDATDEACDKWSEGGFAHHLFISRKISKKTYVATLTCVLELIVASQQKFPDLYAVLKFVPKKNGLNPLLAALAKGEPPSVDGLKPRELRRKLDDLSRTLEQSWLLVHCYLTLPSKGMRDDFLWSARTVVEKVKTDQRSRATEFLCLGAFRRGGELFTLHDDSQWNLKRGFEKNFGVDAWHPKPTNARMVWQRCRMVYPFLEMAYRAWLASGNALTGGDEVRREAAQAAADAAAAADEDAVPDADFEYDSEEERLEAEQLGLEIDRAAIAELLDRIARAGPEEKVLNSLLYWLLDSLYREMTAELKIPKWAPEPYVLRLEGINHVMDEQLRNLGHLLQLLCVCEVHDDEGFCVPDYSITGDRILLQVKEVETASTLLASISRSSSAASEHVLEKYNNLLRSPTLTFATLEQMEFEALGSLLEVPGKLVAERGETVREAQREWRNPELLFRYYEDNRHDPRMAPLIQRWLRAIFGLSDESLRDIRRNSIENMRHLARIPAAVLARWYEEACPGTSKCKTLFMVGEDAGSCLRIISNEGNRYNRALMGYVLQSHVRVLVVTDTVGRVLARSVIRLLIRSDTGEPVIFCDPMFFTLGFSYDLQYELLHQARVLEEHMQIPVVHGCSVLKAPKEGGAESEEGYTRRVQELDYDVIWVDLLEIDGVAPYTYSEELPYDELLEQHQPGVLSRGEEKEQRALKVAVLPRSDSASAKRYQQERKGLTGWTMLPNPSKEAVDNNHRSYYVDEDRGQQTMPSNFVEPSLNE